MSQPSSNAFRLKILLVENSQTARAVLLNQLQRYDYIVEIVKSGTEAIEALTRASYDVIIMDVFLPQMSGYEATQHIRNMVGERSKSIVIGFTSSTSEKDKAQCFAAGMNEYVIKTEDNAPLFAVLEKYQRLFSQPTD